MCCAPRDESFFVCMTPQSSAIYEFRPAIDLSHSKGCGTDTPPSGSTISGGSYSGGSLVMRSTSPRLIITSSVTIMTKRTQKQPANPFHPGEILLGEFLETSGITADAALDLAETLGTSARLWMNLQSTFDLAQAEKKRRAA